MASYQSRHNTKRRTEDQISYTRSTPTSQLPPRTITQTGTTSQIPPLASAKLQKRRPSRNEIHGPGTVGGHSASISNAPVALGSRKGSAPSTVPLAHPAPRPTAPKAASQGFSRLPKLEVPPISTRTPSLVSGESASTVDSPRSNFLRRKQTSIGLVSGKRGNQTNYDPMLSQDGRHMASGIPGGYKDPFSETVLGISLPPTSTILNRSGVEVELPVFSSRKIELAPADVLPPPAPHYASSGTPSTRYSESPGPFSVSSTPTSMSSYSPSVTVCTKPAMGTRQVSPLQNRPSAIRYRTPEERALPSRRGSTAPSPSTSTVFVDGSRTVNNSKEEREPPSPPSPQPQTAHSRPTTKSRQAETSLRGMTRGRDQSIQAREERPPAQAPPELAHLADQFPTITAPRRPERPSRDGTSEITGFRGPSPIIQSNMTSFPFSHKRTTSTDSTVSGAASNRSRFGVPSKQSSRNPSPNPSVSSSFAPPSRLPTRGPTPDLQLEKQRSQTSSAPAPSPSKASRFGFFSRRTKVDSATPRTRSENKSHRRGPVAGTGHEGYGRYAVRTRNASTTSTSSIGKSLSAATTTDSLDGTPSSRKSSVTSTTSTEIDQFFLERLDPVVIRGTGGSDELSRSSDVQRSVKSLANPSISASNVPTTDSLLKNDLRYDRPALLPSAISDPIRDITPVDELASSLRTSEIECDTKKSFIPSLTAKRTSRTSKMFDVTAPVKREAIKERKDFVEGVFSEGKDGNWLRSLTKEKTEQGSSKPSRKWNFFQRTHGATYAHTTELADPASSSPSRTLASRSVAHYALVDVQSGLEAEDIDAIMQEADSTPDEEATLAKSPVEVNINESVEKEQLLSVLRPPQTVLPDSHRAPSRSTSPTVPLRSTPDIQPKLVLDTSVIEQPRFMSPSVADLTPVTDLSPMSSPIDPSSSIHDGEPQGSTGGVHASIPSSCVPTTLPRGNPLLSTISPRPSRLAQVGRIPHVISSRNKKVRLPSRSFSRPFNKHQPGSSAPSSTSFGSSEHLPAIAGGAEPYPILRGLSALTHGSAIATVKPDLEESFRSGEFFALPVRKDSEVSYSSSSGTWSFPATAGTAVVPVRGAPTSEDEVWNEYDDLIDDVLSPTDNETPNAEYQGAYEHLSTEDPSARSRISRTSSHSTASATMISNPSLHLRRSRLLAVLYSQSPTSSVSLSEFLQEYGERNISVVDPITGRLSFPSTTQNSVFPGILKRRSSNRSSLPASLSLSSRQSKATLISTTDQQRNSTGANKYRDTRLMEMAETQADGLSFMANLRFGALMTSKWLSFGRVIFSPAHFELNSSEHDRVLVIDGLGKDWSYYCALTYPDATIYNLGPGHSTSMASSDKAPEPWSTLKNHRHFNHVSLSDPFPFPRGFFACVVLRFPSALPSSVHRSAISECKRVLRPGGFLELTVLDLDLVNMGNRARRAVRGLKVKMQVAEPDVSLRNMSDEIMGLVGRKGFTECNRCFVGVPVAGTLPSPDATSTASLKKGRASIGGSIDKPPGARTGKQPKAEVSFSDLLNTCASSDSTDYTITSMVARVGRWWYSRCYESLVLPEAGEPDAAISGSLLQSSIWRDEALINECEKRGTSFRLLIGYAQKPEVGMRRTVSV